MKKSKIDFSNPDFADLEKLDLDQETLENVVQARIEARDIIGRLEPCHINGWPDLIRILNACLKRAKGNKEIFSDTRIIIV